MKPNACNAIHMQLPVPPLTTADRQVLRARNQRRAGGNPLPAPRAF